MKETCSSYGSYNGGHGLENAKKNFQLFLYSAILTAPLLVGMVYKIETGIEFFGVGLINWIFAILSFFIVFIFGKRFHKMAWMLLKKFKANMDTLVSTGSLSAYFCSFWTTFNNRPIYFKTAVIIIILILLGECL